ncbi:DNA-binding response regulator [Auritidibacter sp. NML130574]|nr:response regulator transcription factor [Auritidibacter sp. NML130574]AXR74579.1 DNA-binding response regulator [Auritidibacter sp. NML130574]
MIRVLLADDQAMFRRALSSYIEITTNFEVVADASNADQALRLIHHNQPDVALLDIQMPGDGLMVAEEVARCGIKTRLIICTTFDRPGYVLQAWETGCAGFVTKDKEPSALISVIRRVAIGERVFDPQLLQEARTWGANPLTMREREVLRASADGVAVREIAARLFLSNGTIRNHLSSAMGKTGARSRAQAVERARERGWL